MLRINFKSFKLNHLRETTPFFKGFTLVEVVMVIVIIGVLAAIIVPRFAKHREQAAIATTYANWKLLRSAIEQYYFEEGVYPDTHVSGGLNQLHDRTSPSKKVYLKKIPYNTICNPPSNGVTSSPGVQVKCGWLYAKISFNKLVLYPKNTTGNVDSLVVELFSGLDEDIISLFNIVEY